MFTAPGRSVHRRSGADCLDRVPTAGDAGRGGNPKLFPSVCTAGERERVNGTRSGILVGLLRLELSECDGEECFCLCWGLPAVEEGPATPLELRFTLVSIACWDIGLPRRALSSLSVSSSELYTSDSDLWKVSRDDGMVDMRTERTHPDSPAW